MKTLHITALIAKHGRDGVAEMVGCHLTNINHVISNGREVYVVLGENSEYIRSYEVRPFPNRNISRAKKQKAPVTCDN